MRWREVLDSDAFRVAAQRRQMAISTGSWRRGRLLALAFTVTGIIIAATIVGGSQLASAQGIVTFSLIFTLWSFLGLLTLPTLSRRGVAEVDHALLANGGNRTVLERTINHLDNFQDREREWPHSSKPYFILFQVYSEASRSSRNWHQRCVERSSNNCRNQPCRTWSSWKSCPLQLWPPSTLGISAYRQSAESLATTHCCKISRGC